MNGKLLAAASAANAAALDCIEQVRFSEDISPASHVGSGETLVSALDAARLIFEATFEGSGDNPDPAYQTICNWLKRYAEANP